WGLGDHYLAICSLVWEIFPPNRRHSAAVPLPGHRKKGCQRCNPAKYTIRSASSPRRDQIPSQPASSYPLRSSVEFRYRLGARRRTPPQRNRQLAPVKWSGVSFVPRRESVVYKFNAMQFRVEVIPLRKGKLFPHWKRPAAKEPAAPLGPLPRLSLFAFGAKIGEWGRDRDKGRTG